MRKANVNVQAQSQAQATNTRSKVKTAGIFCGGVATGGILGAIGMHLYHKKKALDEMEEVIINKDVPLNESSDPEDSVDSDFCEVPDPEPVKPSREPVQEEVTEESELVRTVQENEPEEPDQVQEVQEEIEEPVKGGEIDEISGSKETPEIRNEPDNTVTKPETVPEVQEVPCKKSAPAQMVTSVNPVVQKVIDFLNGESTICDETGVQSKAENIYDVIAYTIMLIADNPKSLTLDDKLDLAKMFRKAGVDVSCRALVSFVYKFYNETVTDSYSICVALDNANKIQKRMVTFPEQTFIELMSKYALDAACMFIDTVVTPDACNNVIEMLNYVVDKGTMSVYSFKVIVDMLKKISCFISKQKRNGKISLSLMRHFEEIVESSGVKYTDDYYDDIYPVINDNKAPLQVLMTDCSEVIYKRSINDFAEKNGASDPTISCLQAFPDTIRNIEKMVSENKYGEAKETYRDMILPILWDEVIVKQYPELKTIIRNIGDRINDMFIHSLNERFKKECVRHEKKQAVAEAREAAPVEAHEKAAEATEDSSIEEEEVKTNTGKTYPAKSKNKNRRRNGRR